jgi:hypothetical protein
MFSSESAGTKLFHVEQLISARFNWSQADLSPHENGYPMSWRRMLIVCWSKTERFDTINAPDATNLIDGEILQ